MRSVVRIHPDPPLDQMFLRLKMSRYFKIIIPIFILLVAMCIGVVWYVHYKLITNFLDKKSVIFSVLPIEYTFDDYEIIKNTPFDISFKINGLKAGPLNNLNPKIVDNFGEMWMIGYQTNYSNLQVSSNIINRTFYIKSNSKEIRSKEIDAKCKLDKEIEHYISYQWKKGIGFSDLKDLDLNNLFGKEYKINYVGNSFQCYYKNNTTKDSNISSNFEKYFSARYDDSTCLYENLGEDKYKLKGNLQIKFDIDFTKLKGKNLNPYEEIFLKKYINNELGFYINTTFKIKSEVDLSKTNGLDYYDFKTFDINLDYKNDAFGFNIDSKNVLPESSKNKLQVIDYSKMLESFKDSYVESLNIKKGEKKLNKYDIDSFLLVYDTMIVSYIKYFKSIANSYDDKQILIDVDLDLLNFFNFEKQKVGKVNLAEFIIGLSNINESSLEGNKSSNKVKN